MVETTKDSLHENILISDKKAAEKEIENLLDSHTKETEEERLTRLSSEYEELGDLDKAHSYIEDLAKVSPDSIDVWRNYAIFMLRNYGLFVKAEECFREALALCDENDDELFLIYGAMLVQMNEKKRALIFLTKVGEGEHNPEFYIKAHLLISTLYQRLGEKDLMEKHLSYASRMKLRQEGKLLDKESLKTHLPDAQTSEAPRVFPKLEQNELDELYFDLIEFLLPEGFTNLASEVLEYIKDQESPKVVKTKAKILFGERKYNEVLETIEEYLDEHKYDVDAIKLFADAYFHLEKYEESEKTFLRAIRRG
jgi:tetratricopeptide (TPR) repeat protein